MLLTIGPRPPYFAAAQYSTKTGQRSSDETTAYNIGHAVQCYADMGGDVDGER